MVMILKKLTFILLIGAILLATLLFFIDYHVSSIGSRNLLTVDEAPESDAIIVLGAYVYPNGRVSDMLADRLNYGYDLYRLKKASKIIVSGDHGRTDYDEVNAMRSYLQAKGVPREDIFMDHAGFNTYDSLYRLRDVFLVKKAIIVSQEYHVLRALYIAEKLGIEATGVGADTYVYPGMKYYRAREVGARAKAFIMAGILKAKPKYLGDTIPIWESGELTDDGKS